MPPATVRRATFPSETIFCARGLTRSFARGLGRHHGGKCAIENVDLEISRGDVVGIVGQEGAGKTTLLRCLAGLLKRDAGTVEWFGEPFPGGGCVPGLAYVPPMPVYYPFLTARDVLEYRMAREITGRVRRQQIDCCLARLDLAEKSSTKVMELSRDEIKRLSIAEALSFDPQVILVDTSYVDITSPCTEAGLRALRNHAASGASVLLAARETHSIADAVTRVIVLDEGRVIRSFHADDEKQGSNGTVFPLDSPSVRFVAERMH
jgi:ABC-type multidrug transport system, ATPase component